MEKKGCKTIDLRGTPAFERMRNFLGSYKRCRTVCETYVEEKRIGTVRRGEQPIRDEFYFECRTRCSDVERFLRGVECGKDEKLMLWLHYVEGVSIEAASERLYVSRSTAFRISRRAEEAALFAFLRYEGEQEPPKRSVS